MKQELIQKKGIKILLHPAILIRRKILDRLTDRSIVSYPKSGRTWVRFFIAAYFSKRFSIPLCLEYRTLFKKHSSIPRFDFNHGNYHDKNLDELDMYIDRLSKNKVLLIVRDPRDTVLSLYHHAQNRQNLLDTKGMSLSDFIRHPQLGISRIIEYNNKWLDRRDNFSEFLFIKYEDIRSTETKEGKFKEILNFLGQKEIDEKSLQEAIVDSSFEKMRLIEKQAAIDNPILLPGDRDNPDSYKVRKGKVGGYKEAFSENDVDYVNEEIKKLNAEFGYR